MKKFSSVLTGVVVAMAAIALVLTAGVNTQTVSADDPHTHCACGGNVAVLNDATAPGHTEAAAQHGACESVTWTAWTDATKIPNTSGYYYLTVDINSQQVKPATDGVDIHICLNGHTVKQTSTRLFTNVSEQKAYTLSICDCTGEGQIISKELTDDNDGGTFWNQNKTCEYNFFNITIDASKRDVTTKGGTILRTSSPSTINIYDGLYIGGKGGRGATFHFGGAGDTFNMFGGTIQGGTARVTSTAYATAIGGNVYLSSATGTANLIAGTIKDGTSIAGTGKKSSSDTTPTQYSADAGNIGVLNGTLNISDDFRLINGSRIDINGKKIDYSAWIWNGTYNGTSYANSSKTIDHHFHCECGGNSNTEGTSHVCNDGNEWTRLTNNMPSLADNTDYYFFLVGDWTSGIQFDSWDATATNMATNTNVHLCLNGYSVTADASRGIQAWLNGGTLTICDCQAHGTGDDYAAGRVGTNPSRTSYIDCSTQQGYIISYKGGFKLYNGIIDASWTDRDNWGGAVYSGLDIEIYGGKITGGLVRKRDTASTGALGGGAVHTERAFTMYGGEIIGGEVKSQGFSKGGAVYCGTTFTMHGGKISGGTVYQMKAGQYSYGGSVYANGNFTMTGGEITGGRADYDPNRTSTSGVWWAVGGAAYMNGTTNVISGGTISDCYARSCGGVFVTGSRTLTITNATFDGCEGGGSGGNLCSEGATITLGERALIKNGKSGAGGNIFMKKGTLNINGATITGGTSSGDGGNIYMNCNSGNGTLNITAGLIDKGVQTGGDHSIPCIAILNASGYVTTVNITGGTIAVSNPSYENAIWIQKGALVSISGANTYITKMWSQQGTAASLSGGYIDNIPGSHNLKTGYLPVLLETPVTTKDYTFKYEICQAHTVNATSWLVDASYNKVSTGIATVEGAGNAKNGTGVALTASENANYEFLGWAELASADATSCTLIDGATALSYTTPAASADKLYAAVYGTKNATVHYEVFGNATVEGKANSGDVALGTQIKITYNGTNPFTAFTNEAEKIISTSAEVTLTLYTDTEVYAVEQAATTAETQIVFLTESNQIYKTVKTAVALAELPAVPVHYGKEGGFWSLTADGEEVILSEVNTKIGSEAYVTLYLTGYTGKTPATELTASESAQLQMTFGAATAVGSKFTLSFGATRLLPEGWTVVEQGMLVTTSLACADETAAKAALVYGGAAGKLRSSNTELSGVTSANIQNVPAGTTVYAVGYVVYLRAGSTTPEYIYTEVKAVTAE